MKNAKNVNQLSDLDDSSFQAFVIPLSLTEDHKLIYQTSSDEAYSFEILIKEVNKQKKEVLFLLNKINNLEYLMPLINKLDEVKFKYGFITENISAAKYLKILTNVNVFYYDLNPSEQVIYDVRLNELGLATRCDLEQISLFKNQKIQLFLIGDYGDEKTKNVMYQGTLL